MVYKVGDLTKLLQSTSDQKSDTTTDTDVSKLHKMFDVKNKKVKVKSMSGQPAKKNNKTKWTQGAEFRIKKKKKGNNTVGSDNQKVAEKKQTSDSLTSDVKLVKKSKIDVKLVKKSKIDVKPVKKNKIDVKLVKKSKIEIQDKNGQDSESVKPGGKLVKKARKDKPVKNVEASEKSPSGVKPAKKSKKNKRNSNPTDTTDTDEGASNVRTTAGFSPPQGMVHESLQKKPKKRKMSMDSEDEETTPKKLKEKLTRKRRDRLAKNQDDTTIFVGNLPLSIKKRKLEQLFRDYGNIEAIRYRCLPPNDPNVPKRLIAIKKDFHPDRHNCVAFIRFREPAAAKLALSCNGRELDGLHIRVDMAARQQEKDVKKSVFVGNIPFDIEEEALREHFEDCGNIVDVRIIREKKTGLGKGFCYVRFTDTDGAAFAMRLNGSDFSGRELRVLPCQDNPRKSSLDPKDKKSAAGKHNRKLKPSNTTANPFQGDVAKTKYETAREKLKKQKLKGSTKTNIFANDKGTSKPGASETVQVNGTKKRKIVDNSKDHSAKFAKTSEGGRIQKGGNADTTKSKTSFQQKSVHSDKVKTGGFTGNKNHGDKQPRKFDHSKSGANSGRGFGNKFGPSGNRGKDFGNSGKNFGNKFTPGGNKGKNFGGKFTPGGNKGNNFGGKFTPGGNKGKDFGGKFTPGGNKGKDFGGNFRSDNKSRNVGNKPHSFDKSGGKFNKSPKPSFQTTNKKSPK